MWEGEAAAVSTMGSVAFGGITVSSSCLVTSDLGRRGSVVSRGHEVF